MCEVVRTAMWKQCWGQLRQEEVQLKLRLVCDRMNSRCTKIVILNISDVKIFRSLRISEQVFYAIFSSRSRVASRGGEMVQLAASTLETQQ